MTATMDTETAVAERAAAGGRMDTQTDAATCPVRVAVVDDHRLFLGGLTLLLEADPRFEVVGRALSGEAFLELDCLPRGVDVVFMDIDMPGMGGVEATRRAAERWPGLKIVALSMHGDREFYLPMMDAGARGFLVKSSEFAEVAAAAERVAAGGTYFSPELMEALMYAVPDARGRRTDEQPGGIHSYPGDDGQGVHGGEAGDTRHGGSNDGWVGDTRHGGVTGLGLDPLSEREMEVLPLVCRGLSNHEIAERLFISKRTVDKHRANILAKTGCRNTASLVIFTIKHNLIEITGL